MYIIENNLKDKKDNTPNELHPKLINDYKSWFNSLGLFLLQGCQF